MEVASLLHVLQKAVARADDKIGMLQLAEPGVSKVLGLLGPEDLADMGKEKFSELGASDLDRVILNRLAKTYLSDYFRMPDNLASSFVPLKQEEPPATALELVQRSLSPDSGVLDLRHKVFPQRLKLPGRFTIDDVFEVVEGCKVQGLGDVSFVDLSFNTLGDDDVQGIVRFVGALCRVTRGHQVSVSLSGNRLGAKGLDDTYEAVIRICEQHDKLRFVDVTMNPLASIDRADLFAKLTPEVLGKLIFVYEHWLDSRSWTAMVRRDLEGTVEDTHRVFFATRPLLGRAGTEPKPRRTSPAELDVLIQWYDHFFAASGDARVEVCSRCAVSATNSSEGRVWTKQDVYRWMYNRRRNLPA